MNLENLLKEIQSKVKYLLILTKTHLNTLMTDVTGVDMLQGKLRIELCADGPIFG